MIICAAVMRDGKIVRGERHSDAIRVAIEDYRRKRPIYTGEHGFVNNKGIFLNREEAFDAAYRCRQIDEKVYSRPDKNLYSEDLY